MPQAVRTGLRESGYEVGRNVGIEYRWGDDQNDRLPALAADLVRRQVAVIVASGSTGIALAAAQATSTIPIVVAAGGNPVEYGLVASLNRPGSNVTGVTLISTELAGKRLDLLHEMVPQATTIADLSGGPQFLKFENEASSVLEAAGALGRQVIVVEARERRATSKRPSRPLSNVRLGRSWSGSFPILRTTAIRSWRWRRATKFQRCILFPIYAFRGGLMSYGADVLGMLRQVGRDYVSPKSQGG